MPKNASKKSSSSSSSSDDDSEDELIKQQLREATISFEQITSKNAEKSQSKEAIDKKSKRYPVENENQQEEDDNSFKMTPEFQEFVAKKLRSKLDESIELVEVAVKKKKHKKSKTIEDHEFKLLNDFFCKTDNQPKEEINLVKSSSKKHKKKKKETKSNSSTDSETEMKMLKEAAVNPDCIFESSSIEKHKADFISDKKRNSIN